MCSRASIPRASGVPDRNSEDGAVGKEGFSARSNAEEFEVCAALPVSAALHAPARTHANTAVAHARARARERVFEAIGLIRYDTYNWTVDQPRSLLTDTVRRG